MKSKYYKKHGRWFAITALAAISLYAIILTVVVIDLHKQSKHLKSFLEVSASSMTAINVFAKRNNSEESIRISEHWLGLLFASREKFHLDGELWENVFDDAKLKGMLHKQ